MKAYWRDHYNSTAVKFQNDLKSQVGKTVNGHAVEDVHLSLMRNAIRDCLALAADDHVVDLCCGNGLLTRAVAKACGSITGVDFSESLLAVARNEAGGDRIQYVAHDVTELEGRHLAGCNKLYMYEGIQYLEPDDFRRLLVNIGNHLEHFALFVGGVPDADRLRDYYDTEQKMAFYLDSLDNGKPHLGCWWSKSDIRAVCSGLGVSVSFFDQHPDLYTSYYRYDFLVQKTS